MEIVFGTLFFLLGILIGSFLNVVVLRHGAETLHGRSVCPACGTTLRWFELIPLISFVAQSGKCRTCNSAISWQYPLVEFITGVLFVSVFIMRMPFSVSLSFFVELVYVFVIISLLVVIGVYDVRHMIIPNAFVYAFSMLVFGKLFFSFHSLSFTFPTNKALWAGPLVAAPFALLWAFSRGRWMGFGDAKLALGMGWFLGISSGVTALFLAFWIGAVYGLGILVWERMYKKIPFQARREIPFGPFLITGLLIVFFFNLTFTDILLFF